MSTTRKKQLLKKKEIPNSEKYALIYARVSSRGQETEGHGLDAQTQRCEVRRKAKGYKKDEIFHETFSGGGDYRKRKEMARMLDYAYDNPHKHFVMLIDDTSRLARDVDSHRAIRLKLKALDIEIECLTYEFDDTPEGEFVETIFAARNDYDRKQNQRKVIGNQKARLIDGYRAFPALRGYTKQKHPIHKNIDVPNHLADIIKEGLEGFAEMRFVYKSDLVRFFQENGVLSKKQSSEKAIEAVTSMLREVFFAGYIEYLPWDVSRRLGHHKAIITLEVFEKNIKRLNSKQSTFIRKDVREDFELRGLIDCFHCCSTMTGYYARSKTGAKHPYFKCQNKNCITYGKSIKRSDIDDRFAELMSQVKATDNCIKDAVSIFDEIWAEEMKSKKVTLGKISGEKEQIETQITQLSERVGKNTDEMIIAQYEKQIKKLAERLNDLEENDVSNCNYDEAYRTSYDEVLNVLKEPYSVWLNYNLMQRRRFFNFVFEGNLSYSKEYSYRTPNYSLPLRVFELISESDSVDVEVTGIEPALPTWQG